MLRFISSLAATILAAVSLPAFAEDAIDNDTGFELVFDTAFAEVCPQALARKGALLRDEQAISNWGYRSKYDSGETLIIERDDFEIAYTFKDNRCDLSYPARNPEAKAKFVARWKEYVGRAHKSVNVDDILEKKRWIPKLVVITDAIPGEDVNLVMGYLAENETLEIPEIHMISLQLVED